MKIAQKMMQTATVGAENKSISSNEDSEDEYEDGGEVFDMPLQHAQEERKRHRKTVLKSVGVDINKNIIHDFQRVQITGQRDVTEKDYKTASGLILDALRLREKYMAMAGQSYHPTTARWLRRVEGGKPEQHYESITAERNFSVDGNYEQPYLGDWEQSIKPNLNWSFKMRNGTLEIYSSEEDMEIGAASDDFIYPDVHEFVEDQAMVMAMMANGPCKTFCYERLTYLEGKFKLHDLLNGSAEKTSQKECAHRDFYNCRKVDTHIHASACMNQKHLLKFIKKTLEEDADRKVCIDKSTGEELTLSEVFSQLNVNAYDLTVDSLDCHADRNIYHRFDNFNAKYNPMGVGLLREIYIKTNNFIQGEYFAEIIKEMMRDLESQKYVFAELRLSVYGVAYNEFSDLAKWAVNHNVYSPHVRWLIQVPRIYDIISKSGKIKNFGEYLHNVFTPVLEASINPKDNPELAKFLEHVSGFDSVDDESKAESHFFSNDTPNPENWTKRENPPYSYYQWYMFANISVINQVRKSRGMNTFNLRPHCGEAGAFHHLCTAFLVAENIAHGLNLKKVPVMEYLYYLAQVGICMSPLSNNHLFLDYQKSPFECYLRRGLNISLSTDDPLQFHFTKEPLMEEYSIAAQVWKLAGVDMCEIARNSCYHSGFDQKTKAYWLGENFNSEGINGNDPRKTNVPDIRLQYRYETLVGELDHALNPMMPKK